MSITKYRFETFILVLIKILFKNYLFLITMVKKERGKGNFVLISVVDQAEDYAMPNNIYFTFGLMILVLP